jgi:hypothetical protein
MTRQDAPDATLAYAHGPAHAAVLRVRPFALLVPNLLAVVVLFLPISGNDGPLGPIMEYVRRHVLKENIRSDIWEAFITGPFLLALPLALWTIRLCIRAAANRREVIAAWGITLTALAMTLFATGYVTYLIPKMHGFVRAASATVAILAAGAAALWCLRSTLFAYPAALLGMTIVYCADVTLTIFVVLAHSPWQTGSVLGLIVVAAQLAALIFLFTRWREQL